MIENPVVSGAGINILASALHTPLEVISRIFVQVLSLSLVGSYIILLVLLARLLLRKSPGWCSYLLWGIVFIRLILPVFPESNFSLIPAQLQKTYSVVEKLTGDTPEDDFQAGILTDAVIQGNLVDGAVAGGGINADNGSAALHNSQLTGNTEGTNVNGMNVGNVNAGTIGSGGINTDGVSPGGIHSADKLQNSEDSKNTSGNVTGLASGNETGNTTESIVGNGIPSAVIAALLKGVSLIWAIGTVVFGSYHIHSYGVLKKQMCTAKPAEDGVYEIQGEHLSFVLGIFKPAIYLSGELDEASRKVVLCHEQVHLKRRDYLIKPIALAITCIHWFNPLVWLAFYLMSRDCEISCDERVIVILGEESKKVYSYALLDEATRGQRQQYKRQNTCAVLSFGEDGIKNRIKHVLDFKKTPAWLLVCTVVVLVALILGLCSNSNGNMEEAGNNGTQGTVSLVGGDENSESETSGTDITENDSTEGDSLVDKAGDEDENTEHNGEEKESNETDESASADLYDVTKFQNTPEAALERWATAFTDRDDIVLYNLSPENAVFKSWGAIVLDADSYEVEMLASWPAQMEYEIQYEGGAEEAGIRYWMVNDMPEVYPAYETVKLVQKNGLYYVDHQSFVEYNKIETLEQFEAAYGKDYQAANEAGEIYDLASHEKTGYTKAFMRTIIQHVFHETDSDYYDAYRNPVTAAQNLLHLGNGSGEVIRYLHGVKPRRVWSSGMGEGTVALVSYTFAVDNNTIQIPMVLVDESLGVWGLSTGDLTGKEEAEGILPNDTYMARNYVETVRDNQGNQYEFSELGICALNIYGEDVDDYRLIYPKFVIEPVPVWLWEDKLYFPTASQYADAVNSYSGSVDWVYDSICEIDMLTGAYRYIPLPQDKIGQTNWRQLNVHSGFAFINGGDGVPLADAEAVWEGKTVFALSDAQKDAYGTHIREYLLQHPGEVLRLGNRSHEQTTAVVDMNGDGNAEEISIIPDTEEWGHRYYTYDEYDLHMNDSVEEGRFANCLNNEIWAFSPDGEEIYVALYEDGPSGDPGTTIFAYKDGELAEAGTIDDYIEDFRIANGIITATERRDVIQTDWLILSYHFVDGRLVQLVEDTYDFISHNDIGLLQELTLHTAPDSEETFVLPPQTVHFLKTDTSMTWVYVEAENGQSGWFQMTDFSTVYGELSTSELFDTLNMAG